MPAWLDRANNSVRAISPTRLRGTMSRLSTRLTLAMVMMVVVTAAVIEVVTIHGVEVALLPKARDSIDARVRLLATDLDSYIGAARADVRSFRAAAALDGIVRAHRNGGKDPDGGISETIWRERMAARFAAELTAKPLYFQLSLIGVDNGGLELVRADRSGPNGAVRIVPDQELQQRGDADYMVAASALRAGDIYISPVTLNREHGQIEQPLTPVLRIGMPIYAADGKIFGVLIINLDMERAFARIRARNAAGENINVVTGDGDYLVGSDRSREFGFEFGNPYRIQDDYPTFAGQLNSDATWDDIFKDRQGEAVVAAGMRLKLGPGASIAVVDIAPYRQIMAPVQAIAFSSRLAGLGIAVGAVILAILIARSLTRPLRQMIRAVEAFARNQPMAVPVEAGGEIGLLAQTFERMANDIKRESEERLRIFETSLDLIIIVDRRGVLIRISPSAMIILGYAPEEMIGHGAADFLYPEDLERTRREMRLLRRGWPMRNFSIRYVHKGGRPVTLEWTGVWSEPAHQYFFIGRDVSEQKLAEELFRVAVEACPSGMMMTDRSGCIVMVNSEIEKLFGYKRGELLGRPVEVLVPKNARARHVKLRTDYAKQPQGFNLGKGRELMAVRKDGSEVPVEIDLSTVQIRGGMLVLAVVVDISERKHNERLKDEFVSTVSHELRTPLTSITASLALLSAGSAGQLPKPAANLVGIAHSNGQRLVRLVNDILDIEKIESGQMAFDVQQVSARMVVEQAIEISRAYADEFGVKVRLVSGLESGDVRPDGDRLAQVVSNLLSNAIKFSPRGGEVVVAVAERGGAVRIAVADHGLGIPDEFKARIFDKFAQADASDARRKGGTGLGLSIVKKIVERLGGDVGFESVRGKGSVFFVDMPRWHPPVDGGMVVPSMAVNS